MKIHDEVEMDAIQESSPVDNTSKIHHWRKCPMGQHLVREHIVHVHPSKTHPSGILTTWHEHCAKNPSHKDELSFAEIQHISETYFSDLVGPPTSGVLKFKNSDKYDALIRGWVRYWNDIFKPEDLLDPNLVKALIATESSFKENPKKIASAHGLMQIRDDTFHYLRGEKRELKDHFLLIKKNELLNPSVNICAGVRWLFRKQQTASDKLKRNATWEEAIEDYKSYLQKIINKTKYNKKPMEKLRNYYDILLGKVK